MQLRDDQTYLLKIMGLTLLQLQAAEKVIRLCMTYVLQRQPLTLESLQAQEASERTKTLGYFLAELRKRADVHDGFDELLKSFLNNRNDFIHDLSRVVTGGTTSPEGVDAATKFVHNLMNQTDKVTKVFTGLVLAWQVEADFPPPPRHEWFDDVDATYRPLVDSIFFRKRT